MKSEIYKRLPKEYKRSNSIKNAYSVSDGVVERAICLSKLKHLDAEYNGKWFIELYICIEPLYFPQLLESGSKEVLFLATLLENSVVMLESFLDRRSYWIDGEEDILWAQLEKKVFPWLHNASDKKTLIEYYSYAINQDSSAVSENVKATFGDFITELPRVPENKRGRFFRYLAVLNGKLENYDLEIKYLELYRDYLIKDLSNVKLERLLVSGKKALTLIDDRIKILKD